jgi:hypothetical protein
VFARAQPGQEGQVFVKTYDDSIGAGWSAWQALPSLPVGISPVSSPAATSWSSTRTDVVILGSDNCIYHNFRNTGAWFGTWGRIACGMGTAPAITNWGPNRLDIFALQNGLGGVLRHVWYQTNSWYGPETLFANVSLSAPPAAVAWAPGRIDIVSRGAAGNVIQFYYSGDWYGPFSLGGSANGQNLAISSWGVNRLDVFAVTGNNGQIRRRSFTGSSWDASWTDVLSPFAPAVVGVSAASWGPNRIDIVTRNPSSGVVQQAFSNANPPSFSIWYGL